MHLLSTLSHNYTVTYRGVRVNYRRVLDGMIGFIAILYIPLGSTGNYSTIADYTLYNSLLHTHLGFSVYYTHH
jgi:hypothetical protein